VYWMSSQNLKTGVMRCFSFQWKSTPF